MILSQKTCPFGFLLLFFEVKESGAHDADKKVLSRTADLKALELPSMFYARAKSKACNRSGTGVFKRRAN